MPEALLRWPGEDIDSDGDYDEWWKRDGGMSTVDNDVWVFGDSPRYYESNHNSRKSATWGSTWVKGGVEQGSGTGQLRIFPNVGGVEVGERRWPNGVMKLTNGKLLVTFAIIYAPAYPAPWYVTGWGYALDDGTVVTHYNDLTPAGNQRVWQCPRYENGQIIVTRLQAYTEGARLLEKELDAPSSSETVMDVTGITWGLGLNFQWGDRQSVCMRNLGPGDPSDSPKHGLELWRSLDRRKWTLVDDWATSVYAGTAYAHQASYGAMVTWVDGSQDYHMVYRLYEFHDPEIPYPLDAAVPDRAARIALPGQPVRVRVPKLNV